VIAGSEKYVGMISSGITYIPDFVNNDQLVQKLEWGAQSYTYGHNVDVTMYDLRLSQR
jgi:hypothetical protein